MSRLPLIAFVCATLLGCGGSLGTGSAQPMTCGMAIAHTKASTDHPATHGMLIVGDRAIYLSHLPMFHAPHDYQVIVEATFHASQGDPQAAYVQDRAQTGTKLYTLVPEPFVLPDVIQNRRSFHATIYRGHFERGGVPILQSVTVSIEKVILFRKFDPTAVKPSESRYLLFGQGNETFMAHWIVSKPDFDQVLAAHPNPPAADTGVLVDLPGKPDHLPLKEGETVEASSSIGRFQVGVGAELYLETDDLSM